MGISAHFSVSPLLSPLLVFFSLALVALSFYLSLLLFFLSSFLVIFPCFFSASMFLLPFFLAWFLSFVLWEEQLQNIKLERIFHQYQSFLFFLFVSCLALSFRSPFLILSYYYLNLCFCWTRKFYVSKEASYKHQSRNNHNNCKRGKRNLMKKHQKRKNRITIRFRRSRWRRRRKTTKTIMKMMLKMQKINKAGKVVVNYLSTLHLSPKQFVLEVLLKIPNFEKQAKKNTLADANHHIRPPVISQ